MTDLQNFKKGATGRVGGRKQVNFWDDTWVPSSHKGKLFTQKRQILLKYVEELIDATGNLDEELLRGNL
jgi:hypothetical protein